MDNGEVIAGLNETWTFLGATIMEWCSGCVMFMIGSEIFVTKVTRGMPLLLAMCVSTAMGLASWRRSFPDGERGLRNAIMAFLGIIPPGIPAPAALQPIWSGAPLKGLGSNSQFMILGLEEVLNLKGDQVDQLQRMAVVAPNKTGQDIVGKNSERNGERNNEEKSSEGVDTERRNTLAKGLRDE